ncbi:YfcL family protein [Alteromonas aestuariivivens]|uniref:YfcL family protein n=1 Tax=Alteromonas aestuariivivens TaxID=1938339 RepID=A0A3D8M4K2_9ALTE|nr:YfcL family protein [Alteromonas aestuariivivens]RDV24619.1 YfcL family protein [Alteromonas aestuariivivens]
MQFSPQAPQNFIQSVSHIEQQLDAVVDHGSDDELFVASYLQGHFAVLARQLEMRADADITLLDEAMKNSLKQAFAQKELDAEDQDKVAALWQRLVARA